MIPSYKKGTDSFYTSILVESFPSKNSHFDFLGETVKRNWKINHYLGIDSRVLSFEFSHKKGINLQFLLLSQKKESIYDFSFFFLIDFCLLLICCSAFLYNRQLINLTIQLTGYYFELLKYIEIDKTLASRAPFQLHRAFNVDSIS